MATTDKETFDWQETDKVDEPIDGWNRAALKILRPSETPWILCHQCKEIVLYREEKKEVGSMKGSGRLVVPAGVEVVVYKGWYKVE